MSSTEPKLSKPEFTPFVSPQTAPREFTVRAVVLGALLGVIFGASSLYLVLKVGLTVSASIPVAVISLTLFRLASKFEHLLLPGGVVVITILAAAKGSLLLLNSFPNFGSPVLRFIVAMFITLVIAS